MRLDDLAGNALLKRQLSAQEGTRGLSHAYLISGPAGSGKRTLARLMAAAMVCTGSGQRPCAVCRACRNALAGRHPDVTDVEPLEGKREILIEQTRRMRADAFIRPNEAARKVYIIHRADTMNGYAQNSILKLLEEGPAYAAFLLLAENPMALLPTIRSRCEGAALSPVSRQEARSWLARRFPDCSAQAVERAAGACGGILGRGVALLSGAQTDEARQTARALLERFAAGDEAALCEMCVGLEKWDRPALTALLDALLLLLRHALAVGVGAGGDMDAGDLETARRAAALPSGVLLEAAQAVERLRAAESFNVGAGHLCGALCAALGGAGGRVPATNRR